MQINAIQRKRGHSFIFSESIINDLSVLANNGINDLIPSHAASMNKYLLILENEHPTAVYTAREMCVCEM